jgi:glycosyltransferase involved in cell wall biosynthesis
MMAHNSACYIGDAIRSVQDQSVNTWELVICDDASEDDTATMVRPFLDDWRVRYVRNAVALGQARNWWQAITLARAPVFARLDADDKWRPDALATYQSAMSADIDIVYAAWLRLDESRGVSVRGPRQPRRTMDSREAYAYHAVHNTALPSAFAHRVTIARAVGPPDPALRFMVDFEYNLRMLACARMVAFLDVPVTIYRVHAHNVSAEAAHALRAVSERPRVLELAERHANLGDQVASLHTVLKTAMARGDYSDGLSEAVRRDRMRGYAIMRDAVLRCPEIAQDPKVRIDLWLFRLGLPGYRILRLLHWRRLRA